MLKNGNVLGYFNQGLFSNIWIMPMNTKINIKRKQTSPFQQIPTWFKNVYEFGLLTALKLALMYLDCHILNICY